MIKTPYPWRTPPSTPRRDSYRTAPCRCANCDSEENTLGVGRWMNDYKFNSPGKLVLCKTCFDKLRHDIEERDCVHGLGKRLRILFTGKLL